MKRSPRSLCLALLDPSASSSLGVILKLCNLQESFEYSKKQNFNMAHVLSEKILKSQNLLLKLSANSNILRPANSQISMHIEHIVNWYKLRFETAWLLKEN